MSLVQPYSDLTEITFLNSIQVKMIQISNFKIFPNSIYLKMVKQDKITFSNLKTLRQIRDILHGVTYLGV